MIMVKNTQRTVQLDVKPVKEIAQRILDLLGYADFDIGIWFTTNGTIKRYNKQYRDTDKATDILSFPYHTTLQAGQEIVIETDEDKNLGDLIIAPEYVQTDLIRWNQSLQERLKVLLVHGICHLLAYDHITDQDYILMKAKEEYLLERLPQ